MRTRRVRGRLVGEKPAGVHVGQVRAEEEAGQNCPALDHRRQQDRACAIDSTAGQIARCASIAWRHSVSAVFWM